MLLHHSPLPITKGRKHRAEAALLNFFFSICIMYTQEQPFRGGLFAFSRAQEAEEQHEEGCTVRCDVTCLRNTIILLHSSSRNQAKLQYF